MSVFNSSEQFKTGQKGENLACEYLVGKGYKVLTRNYRKPWGEIDIVAMASDRTLVFIEVKTMQEAGEEGLIPEDHMNYSKLLKFRKICSQFAAANKHLIEEKCGWRMDVIAITFKVGLPCIQHYENVS